MTVTTCTLREHEDGWLYIVWEEVDFNQPVKHLSWFGLGMRAYHYKRDYGADRIGQKMYPGDFPGEYIGEDKLRYRLANGGQTVSAYTYSEPIPEPKTKLPVEWRRGRWEKKTARGWQIA